MKKLLAGMSAAIALACGVLLFAPSVFAAGHFGDNGTNYIKAGETVDGAVFFAGEAVHIEGTVNGDVNCAAQTVVITGMVNGDVNCAGSTVTVSGKVTGDVRAAGESVTLGGEIAGGATVFGKTITVETAARIGRDAVFGGSEVLVNGAVGRDLVATAQTGTINGPIGRDVEGVYGTLVVGKDAAIAGFLHYASDTDAEISGTVKGDVKRDDSSTYTGRQANPMQDIALLVFVLLTWIVLIALALKLAFPKKMHTATNLTPRDALLAAALGLIALMVVPIIAVTLIASVIALPLGVILLLAWIALCTASAGVTAIYLGRIVFGKQKLHPVAATALAALGLGLTFLIPFINFITILGSLAFGTGAVLYAVRGEHEADGKKPKVRLAGA